MLSSTGGTNVDATDNAVGVVNDLTFIGESPAFAEVLRFIDRVARCEAAVLLQRETGTGKELDARGIHAYRVRDRTRRV